MIQIMYRMTWEAEIGKTPATRLRWNGKGREGFGGFGDQGYMAGL